MIRRCPVTKQAKCPQLSDNTLKITVDIEIYVSGSVSKRCWRHIANTIRYLIQTSVITRPHKLVVIEKQL